MHSRISGSLARRPAFSLLKYRLKQPSPERAMIPNEEIQRRIVELEVEHRDLDSVIDLLTRDARHDDLQLRRLKKRKLQLKDHITLLKMQLIPDIPA
jgi:hypothetical protein